MRRTRVQFRNAFTLVELLVVIAIIVILMALTVGIMSRVWAFWDESKTSVEISKLSESCNVFKSQFGRYPPARIVLSQVFDPLTGAAPVGSYRWGADPARTPEVRALFLYSIEYLQAIFPGINLAAGHQWSGVNAPAEWYVLEGEEALVYFLGGMRLNGSKALGFNTDKSNPTAVTTGARLGPFFEFDEGRISFDSPNGGAVWPGYPADYHGSSGRFAVYKDSYGVAYAYFASRSPGMNNYWFPGAPQFGNSGLGAAAQQFMSDCYMLTRSKEPANLARSFIPFYQTMLPIPANATSLVFHKADTFQIVSAGKDKLFGCGGNYNNTNPEASIFEYMNPGPPIFVPPSGAPLATDDEKKAVFDNLTNVTSGRVVPQ